MGAGRIKKKIITALTVSLCGIFIGMAPVAVRPVDTQAAMAQARLTPEYRQTEARSMLPLINKWRAGSTWYYDSSNKKIYLNGLKALTYDYTLEKYAMQRAAEIAVSFDHTRTDGTSKTGMSGYLAYGENIAATTRTEGGQASYAFDMFKEENYPYSGQGHRRLMLSVPGNFANVGIACVYYKGAYYWAQEYAMGSKPDTKVTTAVNGSRTMTANVDTSMLTSKYADLSELNNWQATLKKGQTDYLPDVNLSIATEDTWPYQVASVQAVPTWTSSNTGVATVNSSAETITGVNSGTSNVSMKEPITGASKSKTVTVSDPNAVTGVTLNKTTLALNTGASATLTATVAPSTASNKSVTWTSSNTAVATVSSSGVVKGVKAGTATITVKTAVGGKTATCKVTVSDIPVTGISLNRTSMDVAIGDSGILTATVSPANASNKKVNWSSGNASVATVDENGTVKGISDGAAVITARSASGSKIATCSVRVYTIPVTGIMLAQTSMNVPCGSSKIISANVSPANASNKNVIWTSSDTSIAQVDSYGNVKGISPGKVTITATTQDGKKTADCNVRVQFKDVTNTSSWYYNAVYWAADLGITTGSGGNFAPGNNCTREQAVVFLWRMNGKPEPKSLAVKFKDVKNRSSYSYKAIMWASENGIITGANGYFLPNGTCTREQIVTILWRLAGKPEPSSLISKFSDVTNPSRYSYKAILWSIEKRITTRVGTFSPNGTCTRSEIVTFLKRFNDLFKVI